MRELDFYEEYMIYLNWRLNENQISKGKHSLFKISKSEYDRFLKRLETDESFNDKFLKLLKSEIRNEKIDNIIEPNSNKIDDIFDELDF